MAVLPKRLIMNRVFSVALVVAQFGIIVAMLLWPTALVWSFYAIALVIVGGLIGVWALTANRIGNFNIRPEPKEDGALITSGPYRFIRHPMYTAVMLAFAGMALADLSKNRFVLWTTLFGILVVKSTWEERWLLNRYGDSYADYLKTTKRFIPFIF